MIADPAYDKTFKGLFGEKLNDKDGELLLMHFLNSIFYPTANENGFKIREITKLQNESFYNKTDGNDVDISMLIFDICCKCICYTAEDGSKHK